MQRSGREGAIPFSNLDPLPSRSNVGKAYAHAYLRVDVVQELQVEGILLVVACAAVVSVGETGTGTWPQRVSHGKRKHDGVPR